MWLTPLKSSSTWHSGPGRSDRPLITVLRPGCGLFLLAGKAVWCTRTPRGLKVPVLAGRPRDFQPATSRTGRLVLLRMRAASHSTSAMIAPDQVGEALRRSCGGTRCLGCRPESGDGDGCCRGAEAEDGPS